jgi:APA family basic amino acid/polyamine antiporter
MAPSLRRRLGVTDAVTIGLGSMIGAGIFAALAPAAGAAASGVLVSLAIAAVVAYCNATSSARLAALYPASGGTYVYGRERLGPFWGHLAGWGFVVGKTASCGAMALTIGAYLWPAHARIVAVVAVLALTAVNLFGIAKTAFATRILVLATLLVLGFVVAVGAPSATWTNVHSGLSWTGVLPAAGLLFFAFAGYARIATLGEEVRDPERTIPRAVPLALSLVLAVYLVVGTVAVGVLGPARLARAAAPLADVVSVAGVPGAAWVVRIGAGIAVTGVLLALVAGVGRTTLAMARRRDLPGFLGAVHPRYRVPHRAEIAVAVAVVVLVSVGDLRGAIGFSSMTVLVYYAIANASALTLGRRAIPVVGLAGCLVLVATLPWRSTVTGLAVLAVGALGYALRRRVTARSSAPS